MFLVLVVVLVAFGAATPALATNMKNLFEVAVPVMSQSASERKVASKKAFEILLVRVTGRRDLIATEAGQKLVNNARQYVSSFRYSEILEEEFVVEEEPIMMGLPTQTDEIESIPEVPEIDEKPAPTQELIVRFDEKAVKNSLWKQKLPVWGKTRPSTLLWVAIQDVNKRMLLDANEPTPLLSYFQRQAKQRGIPLLFPLLDLEDQININVTDVWGAFKEPVKNASQRYQPEAILSARLFLDPFGVWQSRWTLHQGNDEVDWQVNAPDLETAVVDGLDSLADRLAQRYAHISTVEDESDFLIFVTDVNGLSDYVRVNKYLSALSSIKRADLARIKGSELVFRLDLRSSPKALTQSIALGKVLLKADDPFAAEVQTTSRLVYRLLP